MFLQNVPHTISGAYCRCERCWESKGSDKWDVWIGVHSHGNTKGLEDKFQLLEGIKVRKNDGNSWERGKFEYIQKLKRYELVEGVKCEKGKKIRAKWIYDSHKHEMNAVKVVKECGYMKCKRNSENSKRIFRLCGKCQKMFYCSRRHQRNDWAKHKHACSFY